MQIRVGYAAFDAKATQVNAGWAQFDVKARQICVGWCEFDADAPPVVSPGPVYSVLGVGGGGGIVRFYDPVKRRYNVPVQVAEEEEEEVVMLILMEIAANEL